MSDRRTAKAARGMPSPVAREYKSASAKTTEHTAYAWRDFKALDNNAGTFEGYLAVFTNQDGNGDVLDRGSFTKTLREAHETKSRDASPYLFPILWQHDEHNPIGGFMEAYEDDHGLFVRGQYDMDIEQGRRAYSGAKKGYLRGLSIGYNTVKSMFQKGARHILEVRLFEGSPVTFPANDQALIVSVKRRDGAQDDETNDDKNADDEETKGVSGKTDWPIADRDAGWDSGAAHGRLLEWAGGKDNLDAGKFASVHFWSPDGDARSNVSEYKFPFCDVVGGSVKAIPKAIFAATGSHGIQAAQGVNVDGIKAKIATYYRRMASQFKDPDIVPPWTAKGKQLERREELKQITGLTAFLGAGRTLQSICLGTGDLVEVMANACGMSLDGKNMASPDAPIAALLAGVDGLEPAVKAVMSAWQEFDDQSNALLELLGISDDDYGTDTAVPMHMSQLRSALELKVGRQLSTNNRDRLAKVAQGLAGHVTEIKSILNDNDKNPLSDEMDTGSDYGDVVASGRHNQPGKKSGERANDRSRTSGTTPPTPPDEPVDETTRTEFETMLMAQSLEMMGKSLKR